MSATLRPSTRTIRRNRWRRDGTNRFVGHGGRFVIFNDSGAWLLSDVVSGAVIPGEPHSLRRTAGKIAGG